MADKKTKQSQTTEQQKTEKLKRHFFGKVVADKMDKTRIVLIENVKMHKKYGKQYVSSKRFKAHDEKNKYKVGDEVVIEECRPLSKDKRYKILKKLV